jgi:GH15 family glucan-1,4-alpha-glucosidase
MLEQSGSRVRNRKKWTIIGQQIRDDILQKGFNEDLSSFVQAYDTSALDAANLRIPLSGFVEWTDPRVSGTVEATRRWLCGPEGLVYRYRTPGGAQKSLTAQTISSASAGPAIAPSDGGREGATGRSTSTPADDGLSGSEGSFLACAFWFVENLCYLGRVEEARERFEALLQHAGPLGLYSEELDPETGEQLGNYPQAFTHIGLINSAVTLQQAQEGILK